MKKDIHPKFVKNQNGVNQVWHPVNPHDDFYVSYNPEPCLGMGFLASDDGSDETALKIGGKWYILNGDFRQEYVDAFNKFGLDGMIDFYSRSKRSHGSSWATDIIGEEAQ